MLPKTGNNLHQSRKFFENKGSYAEEISNMLKEELGDSHRAIKTLIKWTGVCERTAKNWMSATRGPSGYDLIILMSYSKKIRMAILELGGYESRLDKHEREQLGYIVDILSTMRDGK